MNKTKSGAPNLRRPTNCVDCQHWKYETSYKCEVYNVSEYTKLYGRNSDFVDIVCDDFSRGKGNE